jgi:ABC-type uncharacterized transport system permease subunit
LAEFLFWPALLAYGEAVVAYFGEARRPGAGARFGIWGVRIGWLVQTALLAWQAARAEGFPWSSWAGSLNLFVWLVIGAYLIWGCRPRFRLVGLAVMPLAVVLFALARAGGGTRAAGRSHYGDAFLVVHVGLVLVAFAGFTIAAALAAVYLWQERRLKRREARVLRVQIPPLTSLDLLAARAILAALPALTLGIAAGVVRLHDTGARVDALMAATFVTWAAYAMYVALRAFRGLQGRRAAYFALAGFGLVILVRIGLQVTHF